MAQYSKRYSVVMSKWHFTWCWNAFITLVALHNSKLPECIYTEGHIAFIPGWFALKHMYMPDCTFAMSDCISQMLEFHFGSGLVATCQAWTPAMSRCGDVGQLDEWTIGRRTRCLRGWKVMAPSSLSGRARDRKQKYWVKRSTSLESRSLVITN